MNTHAGGQSEEVDDDAKPVARPSHLDRSSHLDQPPDPPPVKDVSELPRPLVKRSALPRYLVWIVPLAALAGALYYANVIAADHGATVTVAVDDAAQVQPGKTLVRCRGAVIGKVTKVDLAADRTAARVSIRLRRDAPDFARDGAAYWLVKPDLGGDITGGGTFSSLSTLLSGSYVDATPGQGADKAEFFALPRAPTAAKGDGFHVELFANRLKQVAPGTAVLYRGVEVGAVDAARIADDATHVVVRVTIRARYAKLVRANSSFWFEAPAEVRGGLLSGIELKIDSLRALLGGGIAFASPDDPLGPPAPDGNSFALLSEMPKGAEGWRPEIRLPPMPDATSEQPRPATRRN